MVLKKTLRQTAFLSGLAFLTILVSQGIPGSSAAEKPEKTKAAGILEKEGCLHCHYFKGDGGLIGPPFDGISKYRSEDDIFAVLTKKRPLPEDYPKGVLDPREFMSHVKLDRQTAREVANYLVTQTRETTPLEVKGHGQENADAIPEGFNFKAHTPSDTSRKGLSVYKQAGCAACHEIGDIGGRSGPSLDGIGFRLSKNAIENRIARGAIVFFEEKEYKPTQYLMPPAELSKEQIDQIIEFLMTLPKKD